MPHKERSRAVVSSHERSRAVMGGGAGGLEKVPPWRLSGKKRGDEKENGKGELGK